MPRAPRPAKPITDESLPTVCVSTGVPRGAYEKLEHIAAAQGLTKAALLRKLIMEKIEMVDKAMRHAPTKGG